MSGTLTQSPLYGTINPATIEENREIPHRRRRRNKETMEPVQTGPHQGQSKQRSIVLVTKK